LTESIFFDHFEVVRRRLTAEGRIADSFQNGTNRGDIREAFVRELLNDCTPQFCSVGSGEIIHRNMSAAERRNQIDVVLYNNRFPKLSGFRGVSIFFVETVSSFIEVKSKLTKAHVQKAATVTKSVKSYPNTDAQRFNPTGIVKTPRPYSFVFAYDAAAKDIHRVKEWLKEVAAEGDYDLIGLIETDPLNRAFYRHGFIDGVFVLNKGCVFLDAMPFRSPATQFQNIPRDHIWITAESRELEILWSAINLASEKLLWNEVELGNYLSNFGLEASR